MQNLSNDFIAKAVSIPIMLYPIIKAKEAKAKLSKELFIAKPIEFTEEIKELIRSGKVVILTSYAALQKWIPQNIKLFAKQEAISQLGIQAFMDSTSPVLIRSDVVSGHAAILASPSVVKSQLVAKQFGHYLANTEPKLTRSILKGTFMGGKSTPYYRAEQQAWARSGIPENDVVRQLDITRQQANLGSAMGLPYGAAASLITKILLNGKSK